MVRVHGTVVRGPHDIYLLASGPEGTEEIILAFADDPEVNPKPNFRVNNHNLRRKFEQHLGAKVGRRGGKLSAGAYRYEVSATFVGRFDVSKEIGFVRGEDGGIRGIEGFGHPFPFTRYRLVIESIERI
ncbi:MAG: hypothetical protein HY234_14565 [Acidobacteria bacterium]|nr:hypothetical protein [Acidobacteriota bacterium]